MIRIIDHLKEKEAVLQLNLRKVQAALQRGEAVTIYHPVGHIHGRLANISGVEYVESRGLGSCASGNDMALLGRLVAPNGYRMPYYGEPRGELYIHWFYRERAEDRLGRCEMFHLNMLRYFNVMDRVDVIHIRCAWNGRMTHAMESAIAILECGHATVDFRIVKQADSWEHDTIKEAAEYAVATGKFVYYTHFKGVTRVADPLFGGSTRRGYEVLDIFYWVWLLYRGLFMAPESATAIGPMLRDGINKTYKDGKHDISWSALGISRHHYAGSFQGFDGKALRHRLDLLGLPSESARLRKLWIKDRYTVEMFLSLVFPKSEVFSACILGSLKDYNLYAGGRLPYHKEMFRRMYASEPSVHTPDRIECDKAVITCLYGEHSILREPLVVDSGVSYICVTDNKVLKPSDGSVWKIVYDPWPEFGGRFRHMNAKFRPFRYTTARRVVYMDSSIQITGSILPLFELENKGVLLKRHPIARTIGEELPRWPRLRKMPVPDMRRFMLQLPLVGATLDSPIYEGDIAVWANTGRAAQFGEEVLALVEGSGEGQPFMSNQLCMSALAAGMFADIVGVLPKGLPIQKYRHNTWEKNTGA